MQSTALRGAEIRVGVHDGPILPPLAFRLELICDKNDSTASELYEPKDARVCEPAVLGSRLLS